MEMHSGTLLEMTGDCFSRFMSESKPKQAQHYPSQRGPSQTPGLGLQRFASVQVYQSQPFEQPSPYQSRTNPASKPAVTAGKAPLAAPSSEKLTFQQSSGPRATSPYMLPASMLSGGNGMLPK